MSESPLKDAADLANVAKTVAEAFPDAVQPVSKTFGMAVAPAGAHVGEAISTATGTVRIVLAPLRGMIWGWEQIEEIVLPEIGERFKEKLHRLVTPKPTVAGPALEALKFAGGEKVLRDMYVNLLAASMDKETAHTAHPGFVEVIKQLTPDDAKVFRLIGKHKLLPLVSLFVNKPPHYGELFAREVIRHFSHIPDLAKCDFPDLGPSYLDNLQRLGLVSINFGQSGGDPNVYAPLMNDERVTAIRDKLSLEDRHNTLREKNVQVTDYGRLFLAACVITADSTLGT